MSKIATDIANYFCNTYYPELSRAINQKTDKWDGVREKELSIFQKMVMLFVEDFLLTNNPAITLFIKIPFYTDSTIKQELTNAISHILFMSNVDAQWSQFLPQKEENIVYFYRTEKKKIIWYKDGAYPKDILSGNTYPDFQKFLSNSVPLSATREKLQDLAWKQPKKYNNLLEKLEQTYRELNAYKKYRLPAQYHNIVVNHPLSISNEYVPCPIIVQEDFKSSSQYRVNDLIVVFQSSRGEYNISIEDIRNLYGTNPSKKIIYIGSQSPDSNFAQGQYATIEKIIEFSYRELYLFCKKQYPQIIEENISSAELIAVIENLRDLIINTLLLDSNDLTKALTYSCLPLLGLSYSNPIDGESVFKKLNQPNQNGVYFPNIDLAEDFFIETYPELCRNLPNNKKMRYIDIYNITKNNRRVGKYCYTIENHKSYVRKLRHFIKKARNSSDVHYIIDAKHNWSEYVQVLDTMLQDGTQGIFHFLSYFHLSKIEEYIKKEIEVYNNPDRLRILNNIKFILPSNDILQNSRHATSLDNYLSEVILDELQKKSWNNSTPSPTALMITETGEEIPMTGNVICENKMVKIADVDIFPAELTYCDLAEQDFQEILALLPLTQEKEEYRLLWKERMSSYCDTNYNGDARNMFKSLFPFLPMSNPRNYISKDCAPQFPGNKFIKKFLRKSQEIGLFSEKEASKILSARKYVDTEHKTIGVKIKDALLQYHLDRNEEILRQRVSNAIQRTDGVTFSVKSFYDNSIKTATIVGVQWSEIDCD